MLIATCSQVNDDDDGDSNDNVDHDKNMDDRPDSFGKDGLSKMKVGSLRCVSNSYSNSEDMQVDFCLFLKNQHKLELIFKRSTNFNLKITFQTRTPNASLRGGCIGCYWTENGLGVKK